MTPDIRGSPTYKLAKFLLSFIQPFTTNEYTVRDTFHFVSMLDGKDHRLIMASLDVESLFTNIPLDETIDIVTKQVFAEKTRVNGLSKTDFRRLLVVSTKGTVFFLMVGIIDRKMVSQWGLRWDLHWQTLSCVIMKQNG